MQIWSLEDYCLFGAQTKKVTVHTRDIDCLCECVEFAYLSLMTVAT